MHHRQDGGTVFDQGRFQLLETEPLPPGFLDGLHLGAVAARHISKSKTEISLDGHQDRVTRFDRVGEGGFHGRTAGSAHGKRQSVVGLPGVAQELLHFTHQLDIQGVKVSDRRPCQGLQHGGMGVGGARAQQQPVWCGDRRKGLPVTVVDGEGSVRHQDPERDIWPMSLRSRPALGE